MSYAPTAVKFDGANDYLTRGADLTGIADSKKGIFSCWVRWDGLDGSNRSILSIPYVSAGAFNVYKLVSNLVMFEAYDASTTAALNIKTSKQLASAKWYHILAAWDLATAATHLYVLDVSDKAVTTAANLTIDLTTGNCLIGATTGGAQIGDFALSDLYFAPGQYLDFSVEANRRKFIDSSGLPVDLGSTGATPTGTAPAIFLRGDKTNFGTNSGTGGNFTVNGVLETASTTPATLPAFNAVDFDGSADYLTRGADLTGIGGDGASGIVSFWCRIDGGDGTNRSILENLAATGSFDVRLSSGNTFRIHGNTSVPTNILYLLTNTAFGASPKWLHVLASWDLTVATAHLYINGVSDKNPAVVANGAIDYNTASPNWAVGATTAAGQKFNGAISELYFAPNQYLDLSVQANREKFILNGAPVSLGADGSLPTGTAPAIYLPKRAALVGNNAGTGGNFTVNGAPKDANSTPVYYYAEPTKFDGSTTYFTRGGDLTGIADGKQGTVSFWLRLDGGDASSMRILGNLASALHFLVYRVSTNKFVVFGQNAAGTTILLISSNTSYAASPVWVHVLASWDLANGLGYMYVNNVADRAASPTLTNDTIDYATTTPNWAVGAYTDGTGKLNGALADLWFNTTYLDISQASNRAKFIDQSTLRPVPLGAKGELPTGSQPLLYLGRDYANFGKNLGSGGDFS